MTQKQKELLKNTPKKSRIAEPLPSERPKRSEEEQKRLDKELRDAALIGNNKEVARLIQNGANVDAKDKDGRTALIWAAYNRHTELCELLIKNKADLNAKDNDGRTPLIFAAANGHTDTCKFLIEKSANPNAKDNYGLTPLMHAAWNGHTDTCKFLIEKSANPNAKDNTGWTPLMRAATWRRTETAAFLREVPVNALIGKESGSLFLKSFYECTGGA